MGAAPSGPAKPGSSQCVVVLGAQWGDEGKGKLVDILAQEAKLCCRFNGGANAGHTLVVEGKKYAFHLLPCGIMNPRCNCVIGNGVVMHIPTLMKELSQLEDKNVLDRLVISSRCSLLFDCHKIVDGLQEEELEEGKKKIGTTKQGIGPCYATKSIRNGLRAGDLLRFDTFESKLRQMVKWLQSRVYFEYDIEQEVIVYRQFAEMLAPRIKDTVTLVHDGVRAGDNVLIEGANAALLDIDFGTYPYVTSSSTTAGGVCTGLGVPPTLIQEVIGVVKAYTTRVGEGHFPTELFDDVGKHLSKVGHEFGTTTGRPRRCGWLDVPMLQYSHMLNGYTSINVTKLDVLTGLKELKMAVRYQKPDGTFCAKGEFPAHLDDLAEVTVVYETFAGWDEDLSKIRSFAALPMQAQAYLLRLQELLEVPISYIGVGPDREDMFLV
jgi:adenylosuccinate synthase